MLARLSEALLLGLSVGPACLAYCSPVIAPLVASEYQPAWTGSARIVGLFLAGRLAGYTVVGIGTGLAGTLLIGRISAPVWGGLQAFMGILMIATVWMNSDASPKWCALRGRTRMSLWLPGILGLLSGLSLCPPFAAAIVGAAATASVRSAVFYFWAFFAGTAVYFLPFALLSPLTRREALRQVARVCLLLAGIWLVIEGIAIGISNAA